MSPYWPIVQRRAAEFSLAHSRPGASLLDGLPVLAAHAGALLPLPHAPRHAVLPGRHLLRGLPGAPAHPQRIPDLDRLVPEDAHARRGRIRPPHLGPK
ncbi:hypothetical protein ACIO6T_44105 [Streptomyces sp. NPDC087532]|uniref:hypothetical protein n=1 Tax=unclassified Streptomyces TaxID=2593676 RepID=UPI0033228807